MAVSLIPLIKVLDLHGAPLVPHHLGTKIIAQSRAVDVITRLVIVERLSRIETLDPVRRHLHAAVNTAQTCPDLDPVLLRDIIENIDTAKTIRSPDSIRNFLVTRTPTTKVNASPPTDLLPSRARFDVPCSITNLTHDGTFTCKLCFENDFENIT